MPRLIFQKSRPFQRLLERERSLFSGEALCTSPGLIFLAETQPCLLSDLQEQRILTLRSWGAALTLMAQEKPCLVGRVS